jgi:prevent-host-death family protein
MSTPPWSLQDAKARFSAVVDAALSGEPQIVTRHGRRAVVVMSATAYDTLQQNAKAAAPGFVEHLLSIPKGKGPVDTKRGSVTLREVDFE